MRRLLLVAICGVGCTWSQPPAPPAPVRVVQGPRAIVEPPPPPSRLRIIATNDFHGALAPRPDENGTLRGGGAYVAASIRVAERECRLPDCATMLVDGGDMFQGTGASNLVYGRSVVEVYNYLAYSAAALGNHELDWGQDTLRALMKVAKYPILGANVRYKDGRDVPWIPNDTIVRRGPFLVGIIGVATVETPTTTTASSVTDLAFVDAVPIIDSIAPALRARGAQFVIVIGHIGARCSASGCTGEAVNIATRVTARIDAFISGHSHTRVDTDVKGIPLVQARSRGMAIDVIDLRLGAPAIGHEVREVFTDSIAPDPDARTIIANAFAWLDQIAPYFNRPVAEIATTLRNPTGQQHALGNLLADAMRVVGRGDVAIMNNGGIRQALPAGTATYSTLFEVQPFDNKLLRLRVRGADLRAYFARALARGTPNFHVSGTRIVYHGGQTPGIDTISVLSRPLSDQAIYNVVLSDFVAAGGDNLGFGGVELGTQPAGMSDLDALVAYLRILPQPVQASAEPRLIARP